ncbi:MAG: RNA 2',3'-cyclic phosphodiesterase [Acidobacteriaceae bacterium]|nr:RNA 2',3'-cyclic phosphodiesterase [Acidobacteriaceae bacterium]MBV9503113.1 RNA 2',3'-cyclic phosphodiesterase [Acidobacteriaceae bacterium]
MRLFTAIDLPAEVLLRLERLLAALRSEALIKWSPLDNLHITTKFIGEWQERRLDELDAALAGVGPREPFSLELKDLGWFPNERSPRVLWAGVHGGQWLEELARATEERLVPLGIPREERAFSPHLTLARIKSPVPLGRLKQRVRDMQPAALGTFQVTRFTLYRSDPGSNASIYHRLREYRLASAMAAS